MFIAMNRFEIAPGFEEGFEAVWRDRESFLDDVPGFVAFSLFLYRLSNFEFPRLKRLMANTRY